MIVGGLNSARRPAYNAGMKTKADLLTFAIAFALRSVRLKGRRLALTEDERYQAARTTIHEIQKNGRWRDLNDPLPPPQYADPSNDKRESADAARTRMQREERERKKPPAPEGTSGQG